MYTDYKTKDEVVKEELDIDMEVIRVEIITKKIILKRLPNEFLKFFFTVVIILFFTLDLQFF